MGCFLGCFGLSSNRRRRKPPRKILPGDQGICSYEPLHSSDSRGPDVEENLEKISNSNFRCEPEEKTEIKVKKRVRFNLNVQAYQPVPKTYEDVSSDEHGEEERNREISVSEKKPKDLGTKSSYPSNYRYQNCADTYYDEDEPAHIESDLEDEDYYTDDEKEYEDDDADDEEEEEELFHGIIASSDEKEKSVGSNMSARDRSQYVSPVLNPVMNLDQWKAAKARAARVKQPKKENSGAVSHDQAEPLLQDIAVEASLSSWLVSPKNFNKTVSSKRSLSERSPILDITNLGKR